MSIDCISLEDAGDDDIDCACCCSSVCFMDMVQCAEGHLVCRDCVKRMVESSLGDGKKGLMRTCFAVAGCQAKLALKDVYASLGEEAAAAVDRQLTQSVVSEACGENLTWCRECSFAAIVESPPAAMPVFTCPSCGATTCRKCRGAGHFPQPCPETDAGTALRTRLEEALTQATVRTCPSCRKEFVKQDGCNKMTCPSCKAVSCYTCQRRLPSQREKAYQHFCNIPLCQHRTCGRCILFTDDDGDDEKLRLQVATRVVAEFRKAHPDVDLDHIDVKKLAGVKARKQKPARPSASHLRNSVVDRLVGNVSAETASVKSAAVSSLPQGGPGGEVAAGRKGATMRPAKAPPAWRPTAPKPKGQRGAKQSPWRPGPKAWRALEEQAGIVRAGATKGTQSGNKQAKGRGGAGRVAGAGAGADAGPPVGTATRARARVPEAPRPTAASRRRKRRRKATAPQPAGGGEVIVIGDSD